MAHKRKKNDKEKDYVAPRTDMTHRKELRQYQNRNQRIVLGVITLVYSIIDPGKPPPTTQDDIDLEGQNGNGDDDDDVPPWTGENPRATINVQGYGNIIIELYPDRAPITVDNFMKYANDGFYNGLIFHRVIKDFMVQGGGFKPGLVEKNPSYPAIVNEAKDSGMRNTRGTVAMARTNDPDSATSQWFINTVDNDSLDPGGNSGAGYCVFGTVISGMSVVDEIESVATQSTNGFDDVPKSDVVINSVTVET